MKRRSFASLFVVVVAISLILSGCFGGGSGGDSTPYAASGKITDVQGNGVSGITVSFSGGTSSSTTTDAEGKWQASLKGTVKVEPWGYQFEPPSKTVTASSSKADFVLVGNIETVIEQITVEIGTSDETISSQNYDDAPQVIIPSGTLPQGTEVTYQVLDGMSIHPDSPLSVLGLPIKLEFNNDTVSSFGQGNSSGIITIRGKLNGQEELYTIGVFSGEFWDVHTPTIKDGWWELEIDADRFQTSDMESLSIWDGMKNSVVAFGKWAISNENHNPDLQLYKYQHGNWVKQVNFHHDDARDDVVLLVHGFFSDHTVWDSLASYYSQKFPNVKLYSISYESGFPLESYGTQLVFLLDRGAMEGVKVNIVAHSMGGLVSRSAIQPKMGVDNVKVLVTLGTPHEGVDKKVFSSLTVDASYDLNWWQEILAKIDRAVINGTTTGLRAFYKWTAGPEVRDLEPNSTFLRDLNARRRSSIDMHYFAGGSNASYHLASKTGGFYGSEPNDGLVSVDSALLSSETEMTIQRYLIPHLNHQTLHEDEGVFDKIGEILGLVQPEPNPEPTTGSFRVSIHVESTGEHFKEEVWITLGGQTYTTTEGSIQINDLPLGQHRLEVFATGYKKYFANVTVEPKSVRFKTVYLESDNGSISPNPSGYNDHDYQKLVTFLEQEDEFGIKNGEKLNNTYNPQDPGTWEGISWSEGNDKRVVTINIFNKDTIGSLDVSGCTALRAIDCGYNNFTSLDVSGCTALTGLSCDNSNLTELDVSSNTALIVLHSGQNNLTELDVSHNTALIGLTCDRNNLTELDVSRNTALDTLWCRGNNLTTLDVSRNTALKKLQCDYNNLTELDVSRNTALEWLWCHGNNLTTLDVSNCIKLRELQWDRGVNVIGWPK